MIPSSHWHDNGDGTAWWVFADHPFNDYLFGVQYNDRPCDTCDGYGNHIVFDERPDCPDCSGTGRHTFTVEVECPVCAWFREHPNTPPPPEMTYRCQATGIRSLRVSVVPGMVLPIVTSEHVSVDGYIIDWGDRYAARPRWAYVPPADGVTEGHPITLPPAAAPGMHAVLLAVHQ